MRTRSEYMRCQSAAGGLPTGVRLRYREQLDLEPERRVGQVAQVLVADEQAPVAVCVEGEQRFLEAWVEAGQKRPSGRVLTVGVEDDHVEAIVSHPFDRGVEPGTVLVEGERGQDVVTAELGKLDGGEMAHEKKAGVAQAFRPARASHRRSPGSSQP